MASCYTGFGTATTREQELAGPLIGRLEIISDGLAGLFTQFKSDRPPGFLLSDRCAIRRVAAGRDILDPKSMWHWLGIVDPTNLLLYRSRVS